MIKSKYNFQFVIISFLIIVATIFFFTTKLYFPDDRQIRNTRNMPITNTTIRLEQMQHDEILLEIVLVNDIQRDEIILKDVELYQQNNLNNKVKFEYVRYENLDDKEYHHFYIEKNQIESLEKMYYLTLEKSENEKMYFDYRNFISIEKITKIDNNFLELLEKEQKIKFLEETKSEIQKSLENPNFDEMQKIALNNQLTEIQNSIDELEREKIAN
jgi:hypothetical protein